MDECCDETPVDDEAVFDLELGFDVRSVSVVVAVAGGCGERVGRDGPCDCGIPEPDCDDAGNDVRDPCLRWPWCGCDWSC